ncbi:MAG: methyltransferase domain-containing protein [Burkholderiales bacterium]
MDPHRYLYEFDPDGEATAARVVRLAGERKSVLELGTGPGSITRVLQQRNDCRVVGVEIDAAAAALARPYCSRMIVADLDTLDWEAEFAHERFDAIVAADVLEHLRDPWRCLARVRGLLKPDGHLVASVPNAAHLSVVAGLLAGRFPYQDKGLLDRTHLRFFTRRDFEALLLACGFLAEVWEEVLIAPERTELASNWFALDEARRGVLAASAEGQCYQYVVRAYPSTATGTVLAARSEAQAAAAELRGERLCRQTLESELAELRSLLERQRQAHAEELERQRQAHAEELERQRQAHEQEREEVRNNLERVFASTSWRLTAPLRWVAEKIRGQ